MNCYYYFCLENAVSVDLRNLAIKCRSKKEFYVILQSDCGVYMPPIEFKNADYWRRIVTGKTKVVHLLQLLFCIVRKQKDLKIIQVPQVKHLPTREIMDYGLLKFNLAEYLPSIGSLGSRTDPGYATLVGFFKTKF